MFHVLIVDKIALPFHFNVILIIDSLISYDYDKNVRWEWGMAQSCCLTTNRMLRCSTPHRPNFFPAFLHVQFWQGNHWQLEPWVDTVHDVYPKSQPLWFANHIVSNRNFNVKSIIHQGFQARHQMGTSNSDAESLYWLKYQAKKRRSVQCSVDYKKTEWYSRKKVGSPANRYSMDNQKHKWGHKQNVKNRKATNIKQMDNPKSENHIPKIVCIRRVKTEEKDKSKLLLLG